MIEKMAIKRLTPSDLTFFRWHFQTHPAGNQKAINLNADVFIRRLYPSLPAQAANLYGRFPVDLHIFGPGLAEDLNLQRKIIRMRSYKNWRLDGEFIENPLDSPTRFNSLQAGDFAILAFHGTVTPDSANLVLIAASVPEDVQLHRSIGAFMKTESMRELTPRALQRIVASAEPSVDHPVLTLGVDRELEDAALGGYEGIATIRRRRARRRVSPERLEEIRRRIAQIGETGELFVATYLERLKDKGTIRDFEWVSRDDATSPFDFRVDDARGVRTLIEVKSTEGDMASRVHLSYGELVEMSRADSFDLYRVCLTTEGRAQLYIAKSVMAFGQTIVQILDQLPAEIFCDGISTPTSAFKFGGPISLRLADASSQE